MGAAKQERNHDARATESCARLAKQAITHSSRHPSVLPGKDRTCDRLQSRTLSLSSPKLDLDGHLFCSLQGRAEWFITRHRRLYPSSSFHHRSRLRLPSFGVQSAWSTILPCPIRSPRGPGVRARRLPGWSDCVSSTVGIVGVG